MKCSPSRPALVLSAMLAASPSVVAQEFHLTPSDYVVFLDGSVSPVPTYESVLEAYVVTRFPQHDIRFARLHWNSGSNALSFPGRPTVIVVRADESVSQEPRRLLEKIREMYSQIRLTSLEMVRPAPDAAGARMPPTAVSVDVAGMLRATVEKARTINPEVAATILPAGNLGAPAGQLLIAQAVLEAWHAPALVSTVEIDALRGTVARAENTTVRELENGRVIAWSQDDRALPMPLDFWDPAIALAVQCSGFSHKLNHQVLQIRGMPETQYKLTIDGETIGVFHRDQLDEGLNLAVLRTPMWKQAMNVLAMIREHDRLRDSRRRLNEAPAEQRQSAEWRASLEALDAAETELLNEQRAKAKPRTHDYELQPVGR